MYPKNIASYFTSIAIARDKKKSKLIPCLANPLNLSRLGYEGWLCTESSWDKICQLIRLDALHAHLRIREKTGDVYLERQDKLSVASGNSDSRIARKLLRESHEVPSRIQFSGDQPARYGEELWKSANWNARIARQDECRHDEVEGRRMPLCRQDESSSDPEECFVGVLIPRSMEFLVIRD